MIVKIFKNCNEKKLEKEVNLYLYRWDRTNIELQFSSAFCLKNGVVFSCMILVKECR